MSDLAVSGSINLREVAGLPTDSGVIRSGVLYRSGTLSGLDEAGVRALGDLGIRRVIDLREEEEVAREPGRLPEGVLLQHTPVFLGSTASFFTNDVTLDDLYRDMIIESGPRLVEAIRGILSDQPALVHCAVGKDRTGVTIALTLAAVGVHEAAIVADYARTESLLPEERNRRVLAFLRASYPEAQHAEELATKSPAPVMRSLLAWIRERSGSVPGYLAEYGFGADELAALREALVQTSRS